MENKVTLYHKNHFDSIVTKIFTDLSSSKQRLIDNLDIISQIQGIEGPTFEQQQSIASINGIIVLSDGPVTKKQVSPLSNEQCEQILYDVFAIYKELYLNR